MINLFHLCLLFFLLFSENVSVCSPSSCLSGVNPVFSCSLYYLTDTNCSLFPLTLRNQSSTSASFQETVGTRVQDLCENVGAEEEELIRVRSFHATHLKTQVQSNEKTSDVWYKEAVFSISLA